MVLRNIAFDLTPTASYDALMEFADGDLRKLAFEKDWSVVGDGPARNSKLLELLTRAEGHYGVRLSGKDRQRFVVWMDTYAQRLGSYSDDQEERLRELRHAIAPLLDE
jgi:hypothetical protein